MATRRAVIAGSLLGSLAWLAGCGDHDHSHAMAGGQAGSSMSYYIDTNSAVVDPNVAEPGKGAALFLSYASGGHWHMETRCDTILSSRTCHWDVQANPVGSSVANVTADSLTPGVDSAGSYPAENLVVLQTSTTTEVDAISFDTVPGAPVWFSPYLDGNSAQANLVVWMSGGIPSVPEAAGDFALTPTAP